MKYNSFLIIFNLLIVLPVFSQDIPLEFINQDMETWVLDTSFNVISEKPSGWFTFNNYYHDLFGAPDGVTKTTDAYEGTYAMRLENTHNLHAHVAGIGSLASVDGELELIRGIPTLTARVPARISFWYKSRLTNTGDISFIRVHVYQGDNPEFDLVALKKIEIPHPHIQEEYTYFETTLDVVSDSLSKSLYIEIDMSELPETDPVVVGDFLQIDQFSLTVIDDIEIPLMSESAINVFPNPATDFVNIEIEDQLVGNSYIAFFDNSGKQLGSYYLGDPINTISLANFPEALFYQIFTEQQQLVGGGSLIKR